MIRRIGLLGGECTGKSTLAVELARILPGVLVPEQVRAFVLERGRTPERHEQAAIMQAQIDAEASAMRAAPQWVVGDPAPLMTAVYSEVYFADDSLTQAGLDDARGHDVLLWCDRDLPWVPDGAMRDGPEYRDREHAVIERMVIGGALANVTLVSGSIEHRLARALAACAAVAGD